MTFDRLKVNFLIEKVFIVSQPSYSSLKPFRGDHRWVVPERVQPCRERRNRQQRHLRRPQLRGLLQARDQPLSASQPGDT